MDVSLPTSQHLDSPCNDTHTTSVTSPYEDYETVMSGQSTPTIRSRNTSTGRTDKPDGVVGGCYQMLPTLPNKDDTTNSTITYTNPPITADTKVLLIVINRSPKMTIEFIIS